MAVINIIGVLLLSLPVEWPRMPALPLLPLCIIGRASSQEPSFPSFQPPRGLQPQAQAQL